MLLFKCRTGDAIPIEVEGLRPDAFLTMPVLDIARVRVWHGNQSIELGECFDISGDAGDGTLRITGDCSRIKWIGAGMTQGRVEIDGPVGMHLGSGMRGGEIIVHGDVSDWCGAEMASGRIHVHGSVGGQAGAGYRGARHGMTGGELLIDGDAGAELGSTMRRGLIAVGGHVGAFAGVSVIAGTLFLFGSVGPRCGVGVKRGSIVAYQPIPSIGTYAYDCEYEPLYPQLVLRHLRQLNFPIPDTAWSPGYRRYSGDRLTIGKGEILLHNA